MAELRPSTSRPLPTVYSGPQPYRDHKGVAVERREATIAPFADDMRPHAATIQVMEELMKPFTWRETPKAAAKEPRALKALGL